MAQTILGGTGSLAPRDPNAKQDQGALRKAVSAKYETTFGKKPSWAILSGLIKRAGDEPLSDNLLERIFQGVQPPTGTEPDFGGIDYASAYEQADRTRQKAGGLGRRSTILGNAMAPMTRKTILGGR